VTLKQAHRFKPAQSTVERPVSREKTALTLVTETFGHFVAMKFESAAAAQIGGAHAYRCFKRDQLTGFSSHQANIRRYMRIVKRRVMAVWRFAATGAGPTAICWSDCWRHMGIERSGVPVTVLPG
jgi:hypothetical protein